jgi:hypothetical protein
MPTPKGRYFVQVGATRDGLDPYLDAAHRRGMRAFLIETPDYIRWRQLLNRRAFDGTLAVDHPAEAAEVLNALDRLPERPCLVLAGFERYTVSAYEVAGELGVPPVQGDHRFIPPDKLGQRTLLTKRAPQVSQPSYLPVFIDDLVQAIDDLSYPIVVKPVNGGGGLGVFLVPEPRHVSDALAQLQELTNYDGEAFHSFIAEEYLKGVECSVQGVAFGGQAQALTFCEKFNQIESLNQNQALRGFREVGHLATIGTMLHPAVTDFVQNCIEAVGYRDGPFHIDLMHIGSRLYFVEMGFRLSGTGLANLMRKVAAIDWAEYSFLAHLDPPNTLPLPLLSKGFGGQLTAMSSYELELAEKLHVEEGAEVAVQRFPQPDPQSEWPAGIPSSLKSDLARHAGPVGRITVTAPTRVQVLSLLQACSPGWKIPIEASSELFKR